MISLNFQTQVSFCWLVNVELERPPTHNGYQDFLPIKQEGYSVSWLAVKL